MMRRTADRLSEFSKTNSKISMELSEEDRAGLKKCLSEIYQDVAAACEKYNLCIMLAGGSALGAVRHKGFIPWDDDIDAIMPRKDYNKLIEIFEEELGNKYRIEVPRTKETSEVLFMHVLKKNTQLICVNHIYPEGRNQIRIDILPLDNAPSNKLKRKIIASISFCYQIMVHSVGIYKAKNPYYKQGLTSSFSGKMIYYIRYFTGMILSLFFSQKILFDSCDKFHSSIKGDKFCTVPAGRKKYYDETLPKNVFFPPSEGVFEGMKVKLPNDVNAYLTNLYGNDYMQLPPVEKRERHFFVDFNLDTTKNGL